MRSLLLHMYIIQTLISIQTISVLDNSTLCGKIFHLLRQSKENRESSHCKQVAFLYRQVLQYTFLYLDKIRSHYNRQGAFKDKDQSWSRDCIVKEALWNRSEKVDHLAYKVLVCTARFWSHQNDKKFGPVLVKLQALYTQRCIWD